MENITPNKAKFFAQYFGQKILCEAPNIKYRVIRKWDWSYENYYLELTPLSNISDEDAEKVGCIDAIDFLGIYESCYDTLMLTETDYLRSKGYALPYNGLSVEQLIKFGWIKLKE